MKNLTQEAWRAALEKTKDAVIIDTRTPEECATGIVENAIMMDFLQPDSFEEALQKLDKSKTYFVYCRSGNRSSHACIMMEELGFAEGINLLGGMNEWNAPKVAPRS